MKKRNLILLVLLAVAISGPAAAKKPRNGFEDWLCQVSGGWLVCDVVKPSK